MQQVYLIHLKEDTLVQISLNYWLFFFGSKIRLIHTKNIKEVKERYNIISKIEPYRNLRYPISIEVVRSLSTSWLLHAGNTLRFIPLVLKAKKTFARSAVRFAVWLFFLLHIKKKLHANSSKRQSVTDSPARFRKVLGERNGTTCRAKVCWCDVSHSTLWHSAGTN